MCGKKAAPGINTTDQAKTSELRPPKMKASSAIKEPGHRSGASSASPGFCQVCLRGPRPPSCELRDEAATLPSAPEKLVISALRPKRGLGLPFFDVSKAGALVSWTSPNGLAAERVAELVYTPLKAFMSLSFCLCCCPCPKPCVLQRTLLSSDLKAVSTGTEFAIMSGAGSRKKAVQAKMEVAGSADAGNPAAVYHNPNLEWHEKIQLAVDAITGYYGSSLLTSMPMKLAQGGFAEPLDMDICKSRYQDPSNWSDAVLVTGGINCLWCSPTESATPNVQVNQKAVMGYIAKTWPAGTVRPLPEPIDLQVDPSSLDDPRNFRRLSPEEPLQALLLHVASRVKASPTSEEMDQWKAVLLSAPARLIRADSWDACYFWTTNQRTRFIGVAKAVRHVATQVACNIWMFKTRREALHGKKLTNKEVADIYSQNLVKAEDDTDDIFIRDEKTVERAVHVYEKVLCHIDVRSILQEMDEVHSSKAPFNTIQKLALLGSKCRNPGKMLWTVKMTKLALATEELELGDFSLDKLSPKSGKAGLLDVMLMKRSMRDYLLGPLLDQRPAMQTNVKEAVRTMFASVDSYSQLYRYADKTFAAGWPASASQLLDLIETSVYTFSGNEFSSIKTGCKNGKTGQDLPIKF